MMMARTVGMRVSVVMCVVVHGRHYTFCQVRESVELTTRPSYRCLNNWTLGGK